MCLGILDNYWHYSLDGDLLARLLVFGEANRTEGPLAKLILHLSVGFGLYKLKVLNCSFPSRGVVH